MTDFNVYIYPQYTSDDSEAQDAKNALDDAVQQLESAGSIIDGKSSIRYVYPEGNIDEDDGTLDIDEFENWREISGYTETGSHLLVTNHTYEDSYPVHGGRGDGGGGFTSDRDAVVHYRYFSGLKLKNVFIQEVLHNFIDTDDNDVQSLLGTDGNSHDLGEYIYTDYDHGDTDWYVSPMATGYEDTHAGHGNCDTTATGKVYTKKLSNCTKDAVKYTNPNV